MSDLLQEITETFDTVVSEMSSDPGAMVPVHPDVLTRVTAGDDDPQFATFVIESGWSKSNRYWGGDLFGTVATEMHRAANGGDPIVGYMGHIRPEDDPFSFPEIQLQWVGAKLIQAGEKAKLAVKAYVLPGTKGRDYLKRGLVNSVSWKGKIAAEKFQKGIKVKDFEIESIDLSRPRAAGMSARLTALTSEQTHEQEEITVKPEEIAALTANELRAHNPGLVTTIETEARQPVEQKVSEMTAEVTAVKPALEIVPELRKLLGMDADSDVAAVIQRAVSEIRKAGKTLRDSLIAGAIDKRIKGDSSDAVLARRLIVGEMKDADFEISGDDDVDSKTVGEMVDSIIDGETKLKEIVSEMADNPAAPATSSKDRGDSRPRELKAGYESKTIRVRAAS